MDMHTIFSSLETETGHWEINSINYLEGSYYVGGDYEPILQNGFHPNTPKEQQCKHIHFIFKQ